MPRFSQFPLPAFRFFNWRTSRIAQNVRALGIAVVVALLVFAALVWLAMFFAAPSQEALQTKLEPIPPTFEPGAFTRPPFSDLKEFGERPTAVPDGRGYPFQP